ncbi:SDR family NAD(P)-dependent oxidoreductase [Sphingomonas sp. Leaf21]|uniref:SDR family NAD(P)-dependent oxidoreductase n=1 Tax=Sphingomonas sp. Leaf21 TaxID=2876550 RepID=UPI003FA68CF3
MEHYIADRPNALITGVSRRAGLGFATAQRLAEQGFRVFMGARDVAKAEPLAAELREHGHAAHMLFLDLADPESICEATCVLEGHIDCLDAIPASRPPAGRPLPHRWIWWSDAHPGYIGCRGRAGTAPSSGAP